MAFVSAVRFMDGEVWWADLNDLIDEAAKLPGLEFLSKIEMLEIEEVPTDHPAEGGPFVVARRSPTR